MPEFRLHSCYPMDLWSQKYDRSDDRAGRRPVIRRQAPDGSLLSVYRIATAANRTETLFIRLDVDGDMFVAIDRP